MEHTKRVWATLPAADADALERIAAAKGVRASDLLREAALALIRTPTQPSNSTMLAPVLNRLEALAGKMERQTQALQIALDLAHGSEAERKDVREALTDIALSVGVLAGSVEPMGTEDGAPF